MTSGHPPRPSLISSSTLPPASSSPTSYSTIPLTTITTYPASCSTVYSWAYVTGAGTPTYFKAYWARSSECHPTGWGSQGANMLYSPGICPSGWVLASQISDESLGATSGFCCPRGLTISPTDWAGGIKVCQTSISDTTTALSDTTIIVVTSDFFGDQWAVSIAWAESDLNRFTPASAPLLAKFDASATSSASATLTETSNTASPTSITSTTTSKTTPKEADGLSTGAKAGIGVGIAIAVLALLAGLLYFFHRQRKREAIPEKSRPDPQGPQYNELNGNQQPIEVMGGWQWQNYHEMAGSAKPAELQGS